MTRSNRWAVMVLAVAAAGGGRAAADEPAQTLKIGMLQGMFRDVPPAMVQAMSRPLRDLMGKQARLDGQVEILTDAHTLADKMTARQLQFGVFHGFEFAWVAQAHPDLVPLVVTVPPGRKVQACVVVHKTAAANSLADLADEVVAVPRGSKAHCMLFLDRQRAGLPATTAKPKHSPGKTAEDVLDAVVVGESAAALIDAAALAGYQSLQPGAFKQLRVLCESERFPPAVIAYRRGSVDEATIAHVRAGLETAHQSIAGKPLMMLWNLRGFEAAPADYPQRLADIRKAYPAPEKPAGPK